METVKSADGTVIAYECAGDGPALIVSVGAFCTRQAFVPGDLTQLFTVVSYDRRGRVAAATPSRSRQKEPPFRPSGVSEQAGPHHGEPEGGMSPGGAREAATPAQRRVLGLASVAAPMVVLDALVVPTALTAIGVHTPPDLTLAALRREFPGYRLWLECVGGRYRFMARRRNPGTGPHTVITGDLAELRAALTTPTQPQARPPGRATLGRPRRGDG